MRRPPHGSPMIPKKQQTNVARRVLISVAIFLTIGVSYGLFIIFRSSPEFVQRLMSSRNAPLPGTRLLHLKDALKDVVFNLAGEQEMDECIKKRLMELNRMLGQGTCDAPSTAPSLEMEQPQPDDESPEDGDEGDVSLSEEEQEFVKKLMRSVDRLTKHQKEALAAVKEGNLALYERLELEVAAEIGEDKLSSTNLSGKSGTSGIKGDGFARWKRPMRLDPNKNDAIFIALVTYRDPQCPQSLVEAFSRAEKPERIFVGVVQQNRPTDIDCFDKYCELAGKDCRPDQVRVIRMKDTDSRGVMLARWLASTLWSGEKWFLQVDAHSGFNYAWDRMVLESIARTKDPRAVLSHHPPDMARWPGMASSDSLINICKYHWDATGLPRFSSMLVNKRSNGIKAPFPNVFIGAGMVFGRAQWIVDCPFDHNLQFLFSGEELLLSICLFTKGWNIYNPDSLPIWHWYARNIKGRENPSVGHIRDKSILRLKYLMGLINAEEVPRDFLKDVKPYFLGNIRSRDAYWSYAGIDWKTKKVYEPFCNVYVNSVQGRLRYRHHYDPPRNLPPLESYKFDTVPMVPIKWKSTAAPLKQYEAELKKQEPSIPKAKLKSLPKL